MCRKLIYVFFLFFIFFVKNSQGQDFNLNKPIGKYHNGKIDFRYSELVQEYFEFNQETVLFKMNYENKKPHFEFNKFGDSTFVYREYFEKPLKIENEIFGETTWDLKREGLVYMSDSCYCRNTIVVFDPETFEEFRYYDSLLLPIGQWKYYYPNGGIYMTGFYSKKGKTGDWKIYEESSIYSFPKVNQIKQYKNNLLVKDTFINVVLEQQIEIIDHILEGIWVFHDPEYNGGYIVDSNYLHMMKIDYYGNIGDTYHFFKNKALHYEKITVAKTEYIKQEGGGLLINRLTKEPSKQNGTWNLIDFEILEIRLGHKIKKYKIVYLSDKVISLKKMI